jgi:aconitate hydratase
MSTVNSFGSKATLTSGGKNYEIYRLDSLEKSAALKNVKLARLPFSLRILLENLLRCEDNLTVTAKDIEALANWDAQAEPDNEIAYMPARVLMQEPCATP